MQIGLLVLVDWRARTPSSSWSSPSTCRRSTGGREGAVLEAAHLRRADPHDLDGLRHGVVPLVVAFGAGPRCGTRSGVTVFAGMLGSRPLACC